MASKYAVRKVGQPNTLDFRAFIEKDGIPVSPFHDIPLFANEQQNILNMVVEIPRWSNAKLEVSLPRLLLRATPRLIWPFSNLSLNPYRCLLCVWRCTDKPSHR